MKQFLSYNKSTYIYLRNWASNDKESLIIKKYLNDWYPGIILNDGVKLADHIFYSEASKFNWPKDNKDEQIASKCLGGIMGGLNSEIRDTTKDVMFEAAKFARDNIRKTSSALGQVSDSSSRFAKGVDEYATVLAMKRALHLIEELGCGKVASTHVEVNSGNSVETREMKVSLEKVNGVLAITVPEEDLLPIIFLPVRFSSSEINSIGTKFF